MTGEIERRGNHAPAGTGRPQQGSSHSYPAGRPAGGLDPEWAMVGVDVPAGKYASRHLKGAAFDVAVDRHLNAEGWQFDAVLQNMLIITKPTYTECLAELMTIWQNWENAGRELPPAGQAGTRALP